MRHETFLRLALESAKVARGRCAPNPSVGAVAVRGEQILATGYHEGPGSAHAEQMTLAKLPGQLTDVTLYVTLEPCNHWGRTPPCVDAIIQSGIQRVVYGFADCNPIVAKRNTPALLREQGIEVIFFPLTEINEFYESYAYWIAHQRPWINAKLGLSLDGKIAGSGGQSLWLSNHACSQFTHAHRKKTDWVLTSAQTVIHDDPRLTVRLNGQEQGKKLAILDRQLRLPSTARLFEKAEKILIFYDEGLTVTHAHPLCEYIPMPVEDKRLDLNFIVNSLGQLGAHDVWLEAGGDLFTAFHLAGLVQRTYLYLTPHVLGVGAIDAYRDKAVFQRQHSVSWRVLDDNVLLTLNWSH